MTRGQRALLWITAAFGLVVGTMRGWGGVECAGRSSGGCAYDPTGLILFAGGIVAAYLALRK